MVAAVEGRQNLRGLIRVADGFVEIVHAVEFAAGANPGVDFLADLFVLRTVKAIIERVAEESVLEGRNGCADDPDSLLVSAGYELTIAGDQVTGGDAFGLRDERTGKEHVIDAEGEDGVFHACLPEHVAIEAHEARLPQGGA